MGVEQRGNEVLGKLLGELGWSPGLLAEAVNGVLGAGYVARSTVSDCGPAAPSPPSSGCPPITG